MEYGLEDAAETDELEIVRYYSELSDEQLYDIIRRRTAQLGHLPRKIDVPGSNYMRQRLGPWPRILEAAGVKEVTSNRVKRRNARKEKQKTSRKRKRKEERTE